MALEGTLQLEYALTSQKKFHWIAAGILAILAPLSWSLGYVVAPFYLVVLYYGRKNLKTWKFPTFALSSAVLVYPVLKIIGEMTSGHDYTGVVPWDAVSLWKALWRIVGDGLILGSLGFWEKPIHAIKYGGRLLNLLSFVVFVLVFLIWRETRWKKQAVLIFISILLGFGIPYYFRGPQFPYENLKWFLRYFATPLWGAALALAIGLEILIKRYAWGRLGCFFTVCLIFLISIGDSMPEHYVNAGSPKNLNLRRAQVAQLEFLDHFFALAKSHSLGRQMLLKHYFIPIVGEPTRNVVDLFDGDGPLFENRASEAGLLELDKTLASSEIWKTYGSFGFDPTIDLPLLKRADSIGRTLPTPIISRAISVSGVERVPPRSTDKVPYEFLILSDYPQIAFELSQPRQFDLLVFETEIEKIPLQQIRFTFEFDEPQQFTRSVRVRCASSRCTFELPMERLLWIPRIPILKILLNLEGVDNAHEGVGFKILSVKGTTGSACFENPRCLTGYSTAPARSVVN